MLFFALFYATKTSDDEMLKYSVCPKSYENLFDICIYTCIMQIRAENQNLVSALKNYKYFYANFEFTQHLKRYLKI